MLVFFKKIEILHLFGNLINVEIFRETGKFILYCRFKPSSVIFSPFIVILYINNVTIHDPIYLNKYYEYPNIQLKQTGNCYSEPQYVLCMRVSKSGKVEDRSMIRF